MVTMTFGTRVSLGLKAWPQPTIGKSLVSKLNCAVCVRMAELCAGMVKLPQRLNVGPGLLRSTTTLSIVSGELLRLSRRIAPASKVGPAPTNTIFGEPCHGTGKFGLARRLSA